MQYMRLHEVWCMWTVFYSLSPLSCASLGLLCCIKADILSIHIVHSGAADRPAASSSSSQGESCTDELFVLDPHSILSHLTPFPLPSISIPPSIYSLISFPPSSIQSLLNNPPPPSSLFLCISSLLSAPYVCVLSAGAPPWGCCRELEVRRMQGRKHNMLLPCTEGAERLRVLLQQTLQHCDAAGSWGGAQPHWTTSAFLQSLDTSSMEPRWWFHWIVWTSGFPKGDAVTRGSRKGIIDWLLSG